MDLADIILEFKKFKENITLMKFGKTFWKKAYYPQALILSNEKRITELWKLHAQKKLKN